MGQKYATITVDVSGNFSGTGWQGNAPGIGTFDIDITDGVMSGTSMSFSVEAPYRQGSMLGTYEGNLNAPFPNATSASGTSSGILQDSPGTRSFSDSWTATRIS
ncbi:MAG: hypothetical protein ABH852_04185 [Methanobacteriota archaeon]